jgi:hypothetical protein
MTVMDRPSLAHAPAKSLARRTVRAHEELHCVVCHKRFDFAAGQTAIVLKHIAYGYDFAHEGACLATAREWIFPEPGYDGPAFGPDVQRDRILRIASADGWAAALPAAPEQVLDGTPVLYEPVAYWALVQYHDGTRHLEGVIRSKDCEAEAGCSEFPEARRGRYASLGYVQSMDH